MDLCPLCSWAIRQIKNIFVFWGLSVDIGCQLLDILYALQAQVIVIAKMNLLKLFLTNSSYCNSQEQSRRPLMVLKL